MRSIRQAAALAVFAWVALGACVQNGSSRCGNGLVCPMGTSCGPSGDRCVYNDLLSACNHATDGDACTVPGLPPNKCVGGVCQASQCGDGRVTGAEQCDGTSLDAKNCQSLGFYAPDGLACTSDCKFDTAACVGKCGDGVKNGPEQCDGPDLGHATCFTAGYYAEPGLGCRSDCTFDTTACGGGHCGDGIINGPEQCDGAVFKIADCKGLGYAGALTTLKCSASCRYTASSCLCSTNSRCAPNTERCDCPKTGGCGCVAVQ